MLGDAGRFVETPPLLSNDERRLVQTKGFFSSLFDINFNSLITPRLIKVLYVLIMVVIGLFALIMVISAFAADAGIGVLTLFVLAPLGALVYLIFARVYLELIIVIFKIRESLDGMAGAIAPGAPSSGPNIPSGQTTPQVSPGQPSTQIPPDPSTRQVPPGQAGA